jgi:heat shock protein HtpX
MKNQLKTLLLLGTLSVVLIYFGSMFGPGYAWAMTIFTVVMNIGAYFFSDRIVLAMHGAKQVTQAEAPELYSMVSDLAMRASIPMPKLYIVPQQEPNAFATGRNPKHGAVACTEGLLRLMSPDELRGVIAHELAHIKNRDILITTVASIMAAAISNLSHIAQWSAIFGGGGRDDDSRASGMQTMVLALVAPIVALILQMAVSRSREYLADETGARIAGTPLGLANALRRLESYSGRYHSQFNPATASLYIVNPFAGLGGLTQLFSTHPASAERIRRLEEMAHGALGARVVGM